MHTEDQTVIPGDVIGFSRAILEKKYEEIARLSVAVIVATAYDVIREYRNKGMSFEQIAAAYSENGVPIKVSTLKWAFGKATKTREATHAPAARRGGGQRKSQASVQIQAPATIETHATADATAATVIAKPTCLADPALPPQEPESCEEPREMTEKEKIDLIVSTIPTPDREYPELTDLRFWQDSNGRRWDVATRPRDEPDNAMYRRACVMYSNGRRRLFEKWGLGEYVTDGTLKLRYTLAKKPPLTVDLDQLIAEHLST